MSRAWNEFVAVLGDLMPGGVPVLAIALFLLTALIAAAWYSWPAWLRIRLRWRPRFHRDRSGRRKRWAGFRLPRLGRLRFRWRWGWPWRRRRKPTPVLAPDLPDDELPDLPAAVLALGADELAAAGRYAEAVRERLRAIIRELIERDGLARHPGWTVGELARAAAGNRPALAGPLAAASEIFSGIWYGLRPATADDDRTMRGHAEQVRAVLDAATAVTAGAARGPEAAR